MILDHGLDDPQHQCVLIYVLRVVHLGLFELCRLCYHELEQVIELGHVISDRILNKVLVDWDALNYIDDSLDIELACECFC